MKFVCYVAVILCLAKSIEMSPSISLNDALDDGIYLFKATDSIAPRSEDDYEDTGKYGRLLALLLYQNELNRSNGGNGLSGSANRVRHKKMVDMNYANKRNLDSIGGGHLIKRSEQY